MDDKKKINFFQRNFFGFVAVTAVQNNKEKQQTGIGGKILAVKENAALIDETGYSVSDVYHSSKPALSSASPTVVKKLKTDDTHHTGEKRLAQNSFIHQSSGPFRVSGNFSGIITDLHYSQIV